MKQTEPKVFNGDEIETIRGYIPQVSLYNLVASYYTFRHRSETLKVLYEMLERAYERYKIQTMRNIHSNNWLRLHGYPMKRKREKDRLC